VTGQMQVGLDFYPNKPAVLVGVDTKTPEIPTIQTPLQELAKKLEKIPIEQIFEKLSSTLDAINKVAQSPEIPEAIRSLHLALGDVRKLVRDVDGQVGPLTSNLNQTVQDIRRLVQNADAKVTRLTSNLEETLKDVRGLVKNADTKVTGLASSLDETVKETRGVIRNVDSRIDPLVASIEKSIKSADATLTLAQKAIEGIEGSVGEDSALIFQINKTLEEISRLARSIRVLSDYLERNPESLLRGK